MPKPEWGVKRTCPTTGRRFYDLNKDPIVSPYTGEVVELTRTKATVAKAAEKAAPQAQEEDLLVDDEDTDDTKAAQDDSLLDDDEDDEDTPASGPTLSDEDEQDEPVEFQDDVLLDDDDDDIEDLGDVNKPEGET